ncbi:hypothetical protein [uncultured Alistipes sp.]|uniref:hypothetical protein n=1 Tax=uncultured Alistipes sp. TaxID=538949 RepID=UPI0025EE145C|nr:hypothetical protein [uncultured Alistipes sp.]
MSIQLTLDGLSFSAGALNEADTGDVPVDVEVLSPRTMLMPREFFTPEQAAQLLGANGMTPLAGERLVWSDPGEEIVAVMAAPAAAIGEIEEKIGNRAHYTTPLLRQTEGTIPAVWMHQTTGLLYIKVYDGTLRFAAVIPVQGEADVTYFTERLGQQFRLKDFELRLSGRGTKATRKLLKGYFKHVVCE